MLQTALLIAHTQHLQQIEWRCSMFTALTTYLCDRLHHLVMCLGNQPNRTVHHTVPSRLLKPQVFALWVNTQSPQVHNSCLWALFHPLFGMTRYHWFPASDHPPGCSAPFHCNSLLWGNSTKDQLSMHLLTMWRCIISPPFITCSDVKTHTHWINAKSYVLTVNTDSRVLQKPFTASSWLLSAIPSFKWYWTASKWPYDLEGGATVMQVCGTGD